MDLYFIPWVIICYYHYLFWYWNIADLARMSPFKMVPMFFWQTLSILGSISYFIAQNVPGISYAFPASAVELAMFWVVLVPLREWISLLLGLLREPGNLCTHPHACTHTHICIVVDMKMYHSDPPTRKDLLRRNVLPGITPLLGSQPASNDWLKKGIQIGHFGAVRKNLTGHVYSRVELTKTALGWHRSSTSSSAQAVSFHVFWSIHPKSSIM